MSDFLTDPLYNIEDEAVMLAFRRGNKDAFKIVYDRMMRPLTYFSENIIHSPIDAEDIVAQGFCLLFHHRANMRSYEHVKRWLYVIVRNLSIDYIRYKSRNKETKSAMAYLESNIDEHTETERVRTVLLAEIHEAIEALPPQRRIIIRLYFFEQKSTVEIADMLELHPQTVLNHKTKALDSLRNSGLAVKWMQDGVPTFVLAAALFLLSLKPKTRSIAKNIAYTSQGISSAKNASRAMAVVLA